MTSISSAGETHGGTKGPKKTNAARASHPSRIVIAEVLIVIFHHGRKIVVQTALRKVPRIDAHLRLALQDQDRALPSLLEEGFLRRPQSLGTSTLDMRRISPDDSLSRNHRQRQTLVRTDSEHLTLLTASTLRQRKD
jgi:hypothetical protein